MLAHLTIDTDALRANLRTLRALAAPARVTPVLKANAYGHGAVITARALEGEADRFCLYSLDEALELRDAGIALPLHVLGPVPAERLGEALDASCEVTLWSDDAYLDDLRAAARRRDRRARVHAKIDTGVTRLGMPFERAAERIATYLADPALDVVGVFSHLAAAEELASSYTQEQVRRFRSATAALPARIERHLAASAAAMLYPETRFDAIRPGIAVYGIWPSEGTRAMLELDAVTLLPALSWRSEIVLVHQVPAGTSVGYGCTFSTERPSRIGVVPIGYAEGIPRAASNRGAMLAGGRRVPIVGRVCMNMTFLDLTDAPSAVAGSTVTLIGDDGEESIGTAQWAQWCDTIDYEIVARLPREIRRETNVPAPPAVSHLG